MSELYIPISQKDEYGKLILSPEEKEQRRKEYMRQYREKNKDKISRYETRQYPYISEKLQEKRQRNEKNEYIINILRESYNNNLIDSKDENTKKTLQELFST